MDNFGNLKVDKGDLYTSKILKERNEWTDERIDKVNGQKADQFIN